VLRKEWELDVKFPKERIQTLAATLNLTCNAVYKWVWDRNRGKAAVRATARQLLAGNNNDQTKQ